MQYHDNTIKLNRQWTLAHIQIYLKLSREWSTKIGWKKKKKQKKGKTVYEDNCLLQLSLEKLSPFIIWPFNFLLFSPSDFQSNYWTSLFPNLETTSLFLSDQVKSLVLCPLSKASEVFRFSNNYLPKRPQIILMFICL